MPLLVVDVKPPPVTLEFEGPNGAILNAGALTVDPGQNIVLIADTIANTGTLTAPGGEITLLAVPAAATGEIDQVKLGASGQFLGLDAIASTPAATLPAPVPPTLTDLIAAAGEDTGLRLTDSGTLQLASPGTDSAPDIAPTPGTAIISGTLNVSSPSTLHPSPLTLHPGKVQVSGDRVALLDATIDASGQTAGGTVLIGGDYQGQGTLPTASRTVVNQHSTIGADALEQGDGGRVIVWGDEATSFSGSISARGGSESGDGGFVEVSGKDTLDFQGNVDTAASNGDFGTLLLDPTDIEIVGPGLGNTTDTTLFEGDLPAIASLEAAIINAATTNVILQATNNITFNEEVDINASGVGLTAMAGNDIVTNAGIETAEGNLIFEAGNNIIANATVQTDGGTIDFQAGRNIDTTLGTLDSFSLSVAGDINLTAQNGDVTTGNLTASALGIAGDINLTAQSGSVTTGNLTASALGIAGDVALDANSDIATGNISSTNVFGDGGRIELTSHHGTIDTTSVTLNAGSVSGDGGSIALNANQSIATGDLVSASETGNGGRIDLANRQGSIDTTRGSLLSGSKSGNGGAINLTANNGSVATNDLISATLNHDNSNVITGNGGAITINANGDIVTGELNSSSIAATGDSTLPLSVMSGSNFTEITANLANADAIAGAGGAITLNATGNISTSELNASSAAVAGAQAVAGSGGAIRLKAGGNIDTRGLNTSTLAVTPKALDVFSIAGNRAGLIAAVPAALTSIAGGNGGNLTLHSGGSITLTENASATGGISSPSGEMLPIGNGGTIDFQARNDISLLNARVDSSGRTSGQISLQSDWALTTFGSTIASNSLGISKGGGINLRAPQVDLIRGQVNSRTLGTGEAGDLTIDSHDLQLRGTQVSSSTFWSGRGGQLTVNATNSVHLSNSGLRGSTLNVNSWSNGTAGDVAVNTKNLLIEGGSRIGASTFISGQGGNITINASEQVKLSGVFVESDGDRQSTQIGAGTAGSGNAGNLIVNTRSLKVRDGAVIQTSTAPQSRGRGGRIAIEATESIELSGASPDTSLSSGILGDSLGSGTGSDIVLKTKRLTIRDGAVVSASTLRRGQGGTVNIHASETVELGGSADDGRPSGVFSLAGTAGISQQFLEQALREASPEAIEEFGAEGFANLPSELVLKARPDLAEKLVNLPPATAQGGNINIRTEQLLVQNGAQIGVNGQFADLDAGNINIESRSILLDRGSIVAETASGEGGNINLWVQDLLLLRHGSQISTTAGTAQAGGNGGNITIDAGFVVAVPGENSDITANAFTGNGGNIRIRTNGIFGLGFRPQLTPLSDITASSEFGVDGTFTLDLLVPVDVSRGLGKLPQEQKPAELDRGCYGKGGRGSAELYDIGRGGMAAGPEEPLEGNALVWIGRGADGSEAEAGRGFGAQGAGSLAETALSSAELRPPCRIPHSQSEDLHSLERLVEQ